MRLSSAVMRLGSLNEFVASGPSPDHHQVRDGSAGEGPAQHAGRLLGRLRLVDCLSSVA